MLKAMLSRFSKSLLSARHRANLARQTDLAKYDPISGENLASKTRYDSCKQSEVGAGLEHLHATNHVGKHILITQLQSCMTMQYRQ